MKVSGLLDVLQHPPSIPVPLSNQELTLARDNLHDVLTRSRFYGVTVGRVANRIAEGWCV